MKARAQTATIRESCPGCKALFEYHGPNPMTAVKDFRRAHEACRRKERDGAAAELPQGDRA